MRGEQRRRRLLWLGKHFRSGNSKTFFAERINVRNTYVVLPQKFGHFSSPVGCIFGDFPSSTANAIVGVVAYLSLPTVAFFLPRSSHPPSLALREYVSKRGKRRSPTHPRHTSHTHHEI